MNQCKLSVLFGWKSNDFHSLTEVLKGLSGSDSTTIPPCLGNSCSIEEFSPRAEVHHSDSVLLHGPLVSRRKELPWWAVL